MEVKIISATKQEFNGIVYYKCGNYFQNKGRRLHRIVWEYHNQLNVAPGHHVHHKDGNRSNNRIDNLKLMPISRHLSLHMNTAEAKARNVIAIDRAREYACIWHGSESGKAFHSKLAKETWLKREPVEYVCAHCGETFRTTNRYNENSNRFCSNKCKSAWRRKAGYDNVQRKCAYCGDDFTVNKYSKQIYCSGKCARSARWKHAG